MSRDSQRSRVYAWERSLQHVRLHDEALSLDEIGELVRTVWRKERGRYGRARSPAPAVQRVHWGQRSAISYGNAVSFPRWARNPWVVLHELAHCLNTGKGGHSGHDARFVGILIGLACRHMGLDRDALLAAAEEWGVKVNLTAIGAVPRYTWPRRVLDALERMGGKAANEIELAVTLGTGYRVVRGALLTLHRQGRIRTRGRAIYLETP